ncbi:CHAT domain-containing protein [Streptomyces sp. NPDC048385]|uniref:CHAT domain-containing protein n=1 Tax=unclassified Streptomyces TaxID=2593676 RepID=UPI00341E8F55
MAGTREERLAAVQVRLARGEVTGPDALADARGLASVLRDGDLEAAHPLGMLHFARFEADHDEADLDQAADLLGPCFVAGMEDLPALLVPVLAAEAVRTAIAWYGSGPEAADTPHLTATIDLFRRILAAIPADHPRRTPLRSSLAIMLADRAERLGVPADLDEAIRIGQRLAVDVSADDPNRGVCLSNLAMALLCRHEHTGDDTDLDDSVEACRAAVDDTAPDDPDRTKFLSNLGTALRARFERTGDDGDLRAAIDAGEEAVRTTPAGHPDLPAIRVNLGAAVQARAERTGQGDDDAVRLARATVDAVPDGHPDRALALVSLGTALHERAERTGGSGELDEAIAVLRAAAPAGGAGRLNNLANALRLRHDRTGAQADLDAAIVTAEEAVRSTPVGHIERPAVQSTLVLALSSRYDRSGALADLDAAIAAAEQAVSATPAGRRDRATYLSALGTALAKKFERAGARHDLTRAVAALREAVDGTPADDPRRAAFLTMLANALRAGGTEPTAPGRRWGGLRRRPTALDEAVAAARASVAATPPGHPSWAGRMANLGRALEARFEHTGRRADRRAAVTTYTRATEMDTAPPWVRLQAAHAAAELLADTAPDRAANLMEAAVRLLPQLAPRRLGRADRQEALRGLNSLPHDAAALALTAPGVPEGERAMRALRLLEAGRAVLLSQALETRSDLSDLRRSHPAEATRFIELRDVLDREDTSGDKRRQAATDLAAVLERIRALDGFASFGRPPTAAELPSLAASGPVVSLTVSRRRADALVLTEQGVIAVPLPGLTADALLEHTGAFQEALSSLAQGAEADPVAAQNQLHEVLGWLWDAVTGPVLHALGHHRTPSPGAPWPRVWWIPGSLLAGLPLHAAGHHCDPPGARRTVMDRVVSATSPTLGALRYARLQTQQASFDPPRALVVAMPTTPGGRDLDFVSDEVRAVHALLPDTITLTEPDPTAIDPDPGTVPTRANVLAHLARCAIAHFSCHGATDADDPSRGLLLLHDHATAPLNVASLAAVSLDQARLAYLSACSTAVTGSPDLIEEAVHLASALQLAGFPHVIGTLWEVDDFFAVELAESFYTHLTLDPERSAQALHAAVLAARDRYRKIPSLWAAYVHAGA